MGAYRPFECVELAGIADVLKDCKRGFQLRMAAAYATEAIAREASPAVRSMDISNREFCVHGIVVHLRLGNCIGYSLREHEWQDRYRSSWH